MPHALVLGAGITGLATAWALRKRGWAVTVADRGPIPNMQAASWDHHRLIRPHYPSKPKLAARVAEAHEAWGALFADLREAGAPGPFYIETGVLSISTSEGDWT
ncbi:MAG: FAD-dependent oxidoreductase, partial [Pseudomonadota bacterium]